MGLNITYLSFALTDLAKLYKRQGRIIEAERLHERNVALAEATKNSELGEFSFEDLAELAYLQGHWSAAVDYWLRPTSRVSLAESSGVERRWQIRGSYEGGLPVAG